MKNENIHHTITKKMIDLMLLVRLYVKKESGLYSIGDHTKIIIEIALVSKIISLS